LAQARSLGPHAVAGHGCWRHRQGAVSPGVHTRAASVRPDYARHPAAARGRDDSARARSSETSQQPRRLDGGGGATGSSLRRARMRIRPLVAASLVVATLLTAAAAHSNSTDRAQALKHYRRGQALYNAGDYNLALGEFQMGYRFYPSPSFFINIA